MNLHAIVFILDITQKNTREMQIADDLTVADSMLQDPTLPLNSHMAPTAPLYSKDDMSPPMPSAILETSRLTIRPFHPTDAELLANEANNLRVAKWMRNTFPSPYSLLNAQQWIQIATGREGRVWDFAIIIREPSTESSDDGVVKAPVVAGSIGLKPFIDVECHTMEIGYWIGEAHWGSGYATEAVKAFSRWAFLTIPYLLRLEASVYEGNQASVKVLEKSGYKLEGVRAKAVVKNGVIMDMHVLGLLREECVGSGAPWVVKDASHE